MLVVCNSLSDGLGDINPVAVDLGEQVRVVVPNLLVPKSKSSLLSMAFKKLCSTISSELSLQGVLVVRNSPSFWVGDINPVAVDLGEQVRVFVRVLVVSNSPCLQALDNNP